MADISGKLNALLLLKRDHYIEFPADAKYIGEYKIDQLFNAHVFEICTGFIAVDPVIDKIFYVKSPVRPKPVDPTNPEPAPFCKKECGWRQPFIDNHLQSNALRFEIISPDKNRCGWNLKPNFIGGHPLDYAPCIYK